MTNREYLIALLQDEDFFDDGGASFECMVHYQLNCPYRGSDARGKCQPNDLTPHRALCSECKMEWLDAEVDV